MATDRKTLTPEDRKLISEALSYHHKGLQRAITMASDDDIKAIHVAKAYRVQALNNRLNNSELDL